MVSTCIVVFKSSPATPPPHNSPRHPSAVVHPVHLIFTFAVFDGDLILPCCLAALLIGEGDLRPVGG